MKNKEEALEPLLSGRCRAPAKSRLFRICQVSLRRHGWLVNGNFERFSRIVDNAVPPSGQVLCYNNNHSVGVADTLPPSAIV